MNTELKKSVSEMKISMYRRLVFSAVVPIILFYLLKSFDRPLTGIIAAGGWGVAVILINLAREQKIDYIALFTAVFSAIGLIGTIISKNTIYYLISPIICDILWAVIFLATLLFRRPLVQIIVEEVMNFPEKIRNTEIYHKTWMILSTVWGVYNILLAVVTAILLKTVSMTVYFSLTTIFSNILLIILISFNFWFARWYWIKMKIIGSGA